jgi:hypothetical protein
MPEQPDQPESPVTEAAAIPISPSLLGPEAIRKIAEAVSPQEIANAIKAMMVTGSLMKAAKEAGFEAPPDWRAREAGIKLWCSYVIGMPVQRQHIVKEDIRREQPLEELLRSPAARAALREALADGA